MQPLIIVDLLPYAHAKIVMSGVPGAFIDDSGALNLCEETLAQEMARLRGLNVEMLISLVEDEELDCVAYEDIADAALHAGIRPVRLPIRDFTAPDEAQEEIWRNMMEFAMALFQQGKSIGLHCMAGIGRSGMMAGGLLVRIGVPPHEALTKIRSLQPEALETEEQVAYLLSRRPGMV